MRAFRFLHTADLHLGTPFLGLSASMPTSLSEALKQAQREVLQRVVNAAIAHQVDFVTVAGDLFDASQVSMPTLFALVRGFEQLQEHQISVYMSHGNHDPLSGPPPLPWPQNVYVFATPDKNVEHSIDTRVLTLASDTRIQISGFSYPSADFTDTLVTRFHRRTDVDFAIALYHGNVGAFASHAEYCSATVDELIRQNFDFWGLGHIHQPQIIHSGHPWIVYPGNPQGRHMRETGPRGCLLVDVSERGAVSVSPMQIGAVTWHTVDVDISGAEHVAMVRTAMYRKLQTVARDWPPSLHHIVRLTARGQTGMHGAAERADVQGILSEECQLRGLPIWVEAIEWKTQPVHNLDILRESPSMLGEFLRLVTEYQSDTTRVRDELLPLLHEVFHPGNGLSLDGLTEEDIQRLLEDALALVLQYVFQGEWQ